MSVKSFLLVTCAVIATTATVRSQSTLTLPVSAPAPAAQPASSAVAPAPAGAPSSFILAPADAPAVADAAAQPGKVDVSALYYFASQNDLGRVAAEIRLLRAKNPDWQPPEDLFAAAGSSADEQPLWDLFAKHDLAGLHAKIDEMKQSRPDWQPSSNLAGKLALAEAHDALVKASDAKQWGAVIDVATGSKMLLTCGDVDALWRTAEALAQIGNQKSALDAYRYVLATCTPPAIRLATVQKASLTLTSPDALDTLVQMGKRQSDGRSEFEQIRLDGLRRKIGDATADPSSAPPAQPEIDAVAANANTPLGQADAQLLGWYNYAHKNYPAAQQWFRTALTAGMNEKAAEGLVLSLREGGNTDETRKAAVQYAGLDEANRKLMVEVLSNSLTDPAAPPPTGDDIAALTKAVDELRSQDGAQTLQLYFSNKNDTAAAKTWSQKFTQWKADEIDEQKSVQGAETLGWQLFHDNDVAGAETWFRKSLDWEPNESSAIGLVLAAHALHHDKDYAARVAEYSKTFPAIAKMAADARAKFVPSRKSKIAELCRAGAKPCRAHVAARGQNAATGQWDQSADAIVKTYKAGQYDATVAMLEQRRSKRAEPRGLSVIRGWALFQKGDWEGAKQVFSSLDGGAYSREKEEGLRVIERSYTSPRYR